MELGYRTPLLELFERGEVPPDIRLLAARGALAPRAHDQLALLVWLTDDADEVVASTAKATITRISRDVLAAFLGRDDVAESVRAFFHERGIEPADVPAATADQPLVTDGDVDTADEDDAGPQTEEQRKAAAQHLSLMSVADRMKRAMLGTREERFILIHDTNRLIAASVLSSPKLTENDVERFARMANVSDDVLRIIGHSRAWMKHYTVTSALALNPKTPIPVALGLVSRLVERDLKAIMRDRNMAEPVRAAAGRMMAHNEARRG